MSDDIQVKRVLGLYLLPKNAAKRVVLLTGARQTGKTTLSKFAYPDLRYINLDAPENRDALKEVSTSTWGRDVGNAVIDEAQKAPVVFKKVKYSFDAGNISFCVLLGASQILLLKKIRETLAGRISLYELWPLMASEIFHGGGAGEMVTPLVDELFTDKPVDSVFGSVPGILLDDQAGRQRGAENYLVRWGGMPALLELPEETFAQPTADF